jgi:hypothetical protein
VADIETISEDEIFGTGALSDISDVEDEEPTALGGAESTTSSSESESEEEGRNRLDRGDSDYAAGREAGADDEDGSRRKKLPSFKKSKKGRRDGEPVRLSLFLSTREHTLQCPNRFFSSGRTGLARSRGSKGRKKKRSDLLLFWTPCSVSRCALMVSLLSQSTDDASAERRADLNAKLDAIIKPNKQKKTRRKAAGDEVHQTISPV